MTRSDPELPEPDAGRLRRTQRQLEHATTSQSTRPAADPTEQAVKIDAETGGPDGPDPTRFGDWERNGRCIDF
jgi:hypothetical protein